MRTIIAILTNYSTFATALIIDNFGIDQNCNLNIKLSLSAVQYAVYPITTIFNNKISVNFAYCVWPCSANCFLNMAK